MIAGDYYFGNDKTIAAPNVDGTLRASHFSDAAAAWAGYTGSSSATVTANNW